MKKRLMQCFVWNETDFIECLGVLPEVAEDGGGIGHHFTLHRDGLRLLLSVYPYTAEILISLFRGAAREALFSLRLTDCPAGRYVKESNGRYYLEFAAAEFFAGLYDGESVIPMGVRLAVDPDFKIELFRAFLT